MISDHLQATRAVEDAVRNLSSIGEQLPDSVDKYRLLAHLELMKETVQKYIIDSGCLYDKLSILSYKV